MTDDEKLRLLCDRMQQVETMLHEHILDEGTHRERIDARMEVLDDIKRILLDPKDGMVRKAHDDAAAATERRHLAAIIVTVLAIGGTMFAMMWNLMQILGRLQAIV